MNKINAYYAVTLFVLYSVWLPFKSFLYLVPFISIIIYIVSVQSKRSIQNLIFYLAFFLLYGIVNSLFNPNYLWSNTFLAFFTFSSLAYLMVVQPPVGAIKTIYQRLVPHAKIILLFQSLLGLLQVSIGAYLIGGFDLDAGDFVEGTIHPALNAERAFSNPMFAVNLFFLILFLIPSVRKDDRYSRLLIAVGSITLIFASVVHVLMFIFIAVIISFIILDFERIFNAKFVKYASVILLIPIILIIFQPKNFSLIGSYFLKTASGELPKVTVTIRSFSSVPAEYSHMPIVGLGPGQFVSRASLIGSGRYIGGDFMNPRSPVPFMEPQMTSVFKDHVFDLWELSRQDIYGGGSTAKPYYSWLAVYTEFGILILIFGLWYIYKQLKRIKKYRRDNEKQIYSYILTIGGLVLLFLGFQENYWEIPQAILWGLTTIIIFFNLLKTEYRFVLKKFKVE